MQFRLAVIEALVHAKLDPVKAQNLSTVRDAVATITTELQRLEEIRHTVGDLQASRLALYHKYLNDGVAIDTQLSNTRLTCKHLSQTGIGTCRICGANVLTGIPASNGIPTVPSERRRIPAGPIFLDYEMLQGICTDLFEPMILTLPPDAETGLVATSMVKYLLEALNDLARIETDLFQARLLAKDAAAEAHEVHLDSLLAIDTIRSDCPHVAFDSNGACCTCGYVRSEHP